MPDTGGVKSQDTPFEGGPMDGRVLPVLLGLTGHPPKTYRIPVPDARGGPPTVLVYRRVPRAHSRKLGIVQGWKYTFDAGSDQGAAKGGVRHRWPWSRPVTGPDTAPSREPGDADR
jgi:hypothetical protein